VPFLFGVAGVIMGGLYVGLDELWDTDKGSRRPSWPTVFSGISYFSLQYYLSGLFAAQLWESLQLNLFLALTAGVCYGLFDRSAVSK
jgi:hypothetical protein